MALPFWAQDGDSLSFGEPPPIPVLIADNKISFDAPLSSLANYSSTVPAPSKQVWISFMTETVV